MQSDLKALLDQCGPEAGPMFAAGLSADQIRAATITKLQARIDQLLAEQDRLCQAQDPRLWTEGYRQRLAAKQTAGDRPEPLKFGMASRIKFAEGAQLPSLGDRGENGLSAPIDAGGDGVFKLNGLGDGGLGDDE